MKKRKLLWQIFTSYALIILLSLIAASWHASSAMRNFFLEQTAENLEERARILHRQISSYILLVDDKSVDYICKEIGMPAKTRITVISPNGRVIGDSAQNPEQVENQIKYPEIQDALKRDKGESVRYSPTLQQTMMNVAVPLKDPKTNEIIAILRASRDISSLNDKLKSVQVKILTAGLIIAILAAGISLFVSRRVQNSLESLKLSAQRFAKGELDYRLYAHDSLNWKNWPMP